MKLLVTRPLPDAERTASRLRAMGHEAVIDPLMRLEVIPSGDDENPAAIVVTSRNAVRAIAAWERPAYWRKLRLFAVGPGTASTAAAVGFGTVHVGTGDAAALADLIARTLKPADGPILHAVAADHSTAPADSLTRSGFSVKVVIAYRMVAAASLGFGTINGLRGGDLEGVLLYSRRSAAVFLGLLDEEELADVLSRLRIFALSTAVAAAFAGRAVGHMSIADAPREDSLLEMVPAVSASDFRR